MITMWTLELIYLKAFVIKKKKKKIHNMNNKEVNVEQWIIYNEKWMLQNKHMIMKITDTQ